MKKIKFFGLLMALCMFLMPLQALAATTVANGTCGESLTWTLTDDGVLTISGTGTMDNYISLIKKAPWDSYKSSITTLVVKEGVTSIGRMAFAGYTNLTKVTFPSTLTAIEEMAFSACTGLTEVVLNEGLTKIGISGFTGCTNLQTIVIPSTLSAVGTAAFTACTSLSDVYFNGTQEEWEALAISGMSDATIHFAESNDVKVEDIFKDVVSADWFANSVLFVYENGMMSGSDGYFKPHDNMTRAMMVTTLYRLSGSPAVTEYKATELFSDVAAGAWYEDAVNWAYNTGVTTGYTDAAGNPTRFGSEDSVTREQLAVFLYRYAGLQGYDTTVRADITGYVGYNKVSDYAKEAMQWAVGAGLISGVESVVNGATVYDLAPN